MGLFNFIFRWRYVKGASTWPDGTRYVGEFKDGEFHGQGTKTWTDGTKYVGKFKNGEQWEGIEYLSSGEVRRTITSGKWCDGCEPTTKQLAIVRKIYRIEIAPTDEDFFGKAGTYTGEVVGGRANGHGTYTWPEGREYVGEWKDGKRNGQGALTNKGSAFDPDWTYVGEFKEGKFHGQGTLESARGDKYVGEWKDNERHGQGTRTDPYGNKYVGQWRNDARYRGTYTYDDGSKYVGKYQSSGGTISAGSDDVIESEGISYFPSGKIKSTYSNGKPCKDCRPTARQLAIVREINQSEISPDGKNKGWLRPHETSSPEPDSETDPGFKSKTLPPGLYYIGDLMYLSLSEEEFEKSMDEIGVFTNEKGQKCAVFRTMAGDGVYLDNDGHSYSVDSGMIGAYPINSLEEAHSLGKGVEFLEEVRAGYDEETSIISFGDIHIHTDPFDEVNHPDVEGTYVGDYKDGMPNGQGTLSFPNGDTYVGEWKDGMRHGQGTFKNGDGEFEGLSFVGEWKDDVWWNGTLYDREGDALETYSEGKPR